MLFFYISFKKERSSKCDIHSFFLSTFVLAVKHIVSSDAKSLDFPFTVSLFIGQSISIVILVVW